MWRAKGSQLGSWVLLAVAVASVAGVTSVHAQTYTVLHAFTGKYDDGAFPQGGVVMDSAGNLYGETLQGGGSCKYAYPTDNGCGVVYKIGPNGNFSILVAFHGNNGNAGGAALVLHKDVLYGTTGGGGSSNLGVVFTIHTDGTDFRKLHEFTGPDGFSPIDKIAVDGKGDVFGGTLGGGPDFTPSTFAGSGVLWEVRPDKTFTALHNFHGAADGAYPTGVMLDSNNDVIGTTQGDYAASVAPSVYKYTTSTGVIVPLHLFDTLVEGEEPLFGGMNGNGNIFGYTQVGGYHRPAGYSFELTNNSGAYNYHALDTFPTNVPPSGLSVTGHNRLLGVTSRGGPAEGGTVYSYDAGTTTTLYEVPKEISQGRTLIGAPIQTPDGTIYGISLDGGVHCRQQQGGCGVVWRLSPH